MSEVTEGLVQRIAPTLQLCHYGNGKQDYFMRGSEDRGYAEHLSEHR